MGIRSSVLAAAGLLIMLGAEIVSARDASGMHLATIDQVTITFGLRNAEDGTDIVDEFGVQQKVRFTFGGTSQRGLEDWARLPIPENGLVRVHPDEQDILLDLGSGPFSIRSSDPTYAFHSIGFWNGHGRGGDTITVSGGLSTLLPPVEWATQEDWNKGIALGPSSVALIGFSYTGRTPWDTLPENATFLDGLGLFDRERTDLPENMLLFQFTDQGRIHGENLPDQTNNLGVAFGAEFLSHEISTVPLPAAAWLFLGALGSLGVLRRFRTRAA